MTNRKGFTLIELLIVVVIIGILAAIAIPKFANTKEKAVLAGMKSDLRNLVTAEEGFFSDNQTYSTTLGAAQVNTAAGGACGGTVVFVPTAGNVITPASCTAAGWNATVTNAKAGHIGGPLSMMDLLVTLYRQMGIDPDSMRD